MLRLRAAVLTALLVAASPFARAACECGYYDPTTRALWTDATISYFNESGADSIVMQSAVSPQIYGSQPSGDTGDGQQDWAVVGNHINDWEDDFGATFRSAVSYNNTFIDNNSSLGLAMQVSPPNLKTRIVNGSQVVTRRRDIQYGSFRAAILPPVVQDYGAAFSFGAAYNDSERIETRLYMSDIKLTYPSNTSLYWKYDATGTKQKAFYNNYTYLDVDRSETFIEHRMDWLNDTVMQFRNNGNNDSLTSHFLEYVKHVNASNVPTMPAPFSFQTWANGEPSVSQGPPIVAPLITHVLYARLFYNSTLLERQSQFVEQCIAVSASLASSETSVCSTDDLTLRGSTAFSIDALNRVLPGETTFRAPLYAIVAETLLLATTILVLIHGIVIRKKNDLEKRLSCISTTSDKNLSQSAAGRIPPSSHTADEDDTEDEEQPRLHGQGEVSAATVAQAASRGSQMTRDSVRIPDFGLDWELDSDFDVDDLDDVEPITGDIEPRDAVVEDKQETKDHLPRFSVARAVSSLQVPTATLDRTSAYRRQLSNNSNSSGSPPSSNSLSEKNGSEDFNDKDEGSHSGYAEPAARHSLNWATLSAGAAIVSWGKRDDDGGEVGQLARPRRQSMAVINARRPSTLFVQESFIQTCYKKMHELIFISGGTMKTASGERRIDYLDGMRGFACLFVSVSHFLIMFYPGVTNNVSPRHYPTFEKWFKTILSPIIVDAPLLLGIFFMLPSRTVCSRYLQKGGLASMGESTVRRIPRLALPVFGACLANYFMIDISAYSWTPKLASRTWSTWAYYQNFNNVMSFVDSFIALWWATPPASPALVTGYATGVLWSIPLLVQGMWSAMLTTLIAFEIKQAWKRFIFYTLCIASSYASNSWNMMFIGGLIIADLDSVLNYRRFASKGVTIGYGISIRGVHVVWVLFFAAASVHWFLSAGGLGSNIVTDDYDVHTNYLTGTLHGQVKGDIINYTYPQPSTWPWLMFLFVLADFSDFVQNCFRLRIWSFLGRHSMAYFLCHGIIFWTWGAWVFLQSLAAGAPYWAAVLVTFLTSYVWLTLLCVCFTATFEAWSITLSKATWRAASGALNRKL